MSYYDQVKEAADAIAAKIPRAPHAAIVLGSGLGDFANSLGDPVSMPYASLPHWPASKVIGHEGRLVIGRTRGKAIGALAGRVHAYGGDDLKTGTLAVPALGRLATRGLGPTS